MKYGINAEDSTRILASSIAGYLIKKNNPKTLLPSHPYSYFVIQSTFIWNHQNNT